MKGKIYIQGSSAIKWTGIVERFRSDEADSVVIAESNNKIIDFEMTENEANDSFVARFDLGSSADACVEKPLIIFDKNATDATGTMANQNIAVGTATSLASNTFARTNYTFSGWNTAAD